MGRVGYRKDVVTLSDTKTGKSIRPLSCAAIEIIKRQERTNEYVFAPTGKPIGHLSHLFARLGMSKEVTPHVHSYASLAGDLGLPDHTIARLLGHSQSSITSRYIHMEKSVIEASNLVAQETLRLMRCYTRNPNTQ
jgi:integrase